MTTVLTDNSPAPTSWTWLALATVMVGILYAPLFPGMMQEWSEFPSLSHGFAIPFIAAYLIWARRDGLRGARVEPCAWGLPVLVVGLGLLTVGIRGDEPFAARISLPITLLGLTLFLGGTRLAREAWLGIAYLVFMVPLPYSTLKLVMYRSRIVDAAVSAQILGWLGVPVLQDGVMLHLPNLTIEVADNCSSIPALAALLSLGVAYAALTPRRLPARAILVGATIPFAIGANIVRIATTAAAAYYIGPWTLHTAYHMFNGTVNFLFTFALLLCLDTFCLRHVKGWGR